MKYYVLENGGGNYNPLVDFKERSRPFNLPQPMQIDKPVELILGEPIPGKPVMIDYHSMGGIDLISDKVKNVLEPMDIDGIQLVPAQVDVNGTFYDYWVIHVYKRIECLDRDFCNLLIDEDDDEILSIRKIALDKDELGEYNESKRMVFRIEEYSGMTLFHEKVVDVIMSVEPDGFRFIDVDEWTDGSAFG